MEFRLAWGLCALGALLFVPADALAQTVPTAPLTVLPPPPMGAPGAKAVAAPLPAAPATSAVPAPASTAIPIPPLPGMHEAAPRDARGEAPPTVKVVKHQGQVIEQYYQGGQLYMVQVHPRHGVPYTYYVTKGHGLTRTPGAPPVSPVLYTILTWGNPDSK